MGFWDSLRKDIKKGIDEGLEALKEGTEAIKHRAEDVTDDVKKKLKIFELKQKVQVQLTELGGRVYEVVSEGKRRNPLLDEKAKKILDRIKKLDEQISLLEGKVVEKPVKKTGIRRKRVTTQKRRTRKASTAKRSPERGKEKSNE